jgi:hypothetical protein
MFDEGHRFGRVEAQRATKRNVSSPPLHNPTREEPDQWGTGRKKEEAKSKPPL